MSSHRVLVGLLVAGGVALGACGDDDAIPDDAAPDGASADTAAFCDGHRDLGLAFLAQDIDAVVAAVELMQASASDEVADLISPVVEALRTDGEAAFESDEFLQVEATVEEAVDELSLQECGERLAVDGVDYRYDGLPDSLGPGRYVLDFTNASTSGEAHEVIIARKNDGVDATTEELLSMDDAQRSELVTMVGLAHADRDDPRDVSVIDLAPGDHIFVCTLPVGGEAAAEDALSHAAEGMVHELTVAGD